MLAFSTYLWGLEDNMDQSKHIKKKFHIDVSVIGNVIMLLLPWVTPTQVQGTRCKRLLSKHRAIYNLRSCPTPSVDSRDIKHIKRIIQTQAAEDTHTHTHTHTQSLTLLKPALIRGITEASSLSGLKERTHVVTQTPPWQICLENIRSLLHMTGCRPAEARWVRHFNSDNTPNHEEKDKKGQKKKRAVRTFSQRRLSQCFLKSWPL